MPELRKQLLRVITEPSFQLGAGELHADLVAAARPGDLVPAIEELTALHRAKAQRSEHDKARPANTG
nr:hypothetical protein [Saccharomonospora sp. CUA-673]